MSSNLSYDLKKVLLAGIGAVATTAEKSKDIVNELVKKGELTVEQGKVLNEELRHNIKEKIKDTLNVTIVKNDVRADAQSVSDSLAGMTKEERDAIRRKLDELEHSGSDDGSEL